ncbi:hypothetical protein SAMN05421759_11040 [Roseivivax lentus]|uniref:Uncharacterized protein n=1 Tax=Roseivivax lentus TaxID=633194 RepID=A0A1N7NTF6_9RHOB|nr:hypothetical protein SAMN05421759_11040 [Roseivivax lentus]
MARKILIADAPHTGFTAIRGGGVLDRTALVTRDTALSSAG